MMEERDGLPVLGMATMATGKTNGRVACWEWPQVAGVLCGGGTGKEVLAILQPPGG